MRISISDAFVGTRLDKAIAESSFGKFSRTLVKSLIKDGLVTVNGDLCFPDQIVKYSCEVEVNFLEKPITLEAENIPIDIVFEDDDIIVVNKEAGIVCHPAPGHFTGTLVNALLWHCKTLPIDGENLRPGLVHRLDKDTSGLIVIAKTYNAMKKLREYFANKNDNLILRKYICICYGIPKEKDGIIKTLITRDKKNRQLFTVSQDFGKLAITKYKTLKSHYITSTKAISQIECTLLTGRTHQIRVHMKHIGCPIIGDQLYGKIVYDMQRTALHSYSMSFIHPVTNLKLSFTSDLPNDIYQLCQACCLI